MARKIPDPPANWHKTSSNTGNIHTYDIELVTPLFGGGVSTRVNDPFFPIRPTSIRGHLQFWWRATAGAKFETQQSLFQGQEDIWGSSKKKSKVRIKVIQPTILFQSTYSQITANFRALRYALFPFAPQGQPEGSALNPPLNFRVEVSETRQGNPLSSSQWNEVLGSIRAWINFGGLGSRTRRGCGALYSQGQSFANQEEIKNWISNSTHQIARQWPTLSMTVLTKNQQITTNEAWNEVVDLLRYFRQGEGKGRDDGNKGHPGQSRFPEPDTIREMTIREMTNRWDHPDRGWPRGFPRAEFGMPIIFHFKESKKNPVPPDTTLVPDLGGRVMERMASPLIVKPLAISSNMAIPMIIRLNGPDDFGVCLKHGANSIRFQNNDVRNNRFGNYPGSPFAGRSSAIEAFLDFSRIEGFTQ